MSLDCSVLEHEAHIWLTSPEGVTEKGALDRCRRLLCAEETAQLGEIGSARVRHQYLVTRALVRTTLSRYAAVRPEDWEFETGPRGRPEIAAPSAFGLRFNLSHTRGVAACLVAGSIAAGVDVENTNRSLDFQGLAERRFAGEEAIRLSFFREDEKRRHFFALWTLKEAYLKACGHGITRPLRSLVFSLAEGGTLKTRLDPPFEERSEDWQFGLFEPSPSVLMAVALGRGSSPDRKIVAWETDPLAEEETRIPLKIVASSPYHSVAAG